MASLTNNLKQKVKKSPALVRLVVLLRNKKPAEKYVKRMQEELNYYHIPQSQLKRALREMYCDSKLYDISLDEYFNFHFMELSPLGKKQYIGEKEKDRICRKIGDPNLIPKFKNKYETYKMFQQYYGREVALIENQNQLDEFVAFARKHQIIIMKPYDLSLGMGVQKLDVTGMSEDQLKEQCTKILDTYQKVVVEELIVQAPIMAQFHPESVNTVRIASFLGEDGVKYLFSFFRTGRGDSVIDNAGGGGIFASVDVETGIVTTPAISEKDGSTYLRHPESQAQIVGFNIPRWEEALAMVETMAGQIPTHRYVGWDLALTEKRWVLVEANARGQFINQISDHRGFRNIMNEKMGSEY